MQAGEANIAIIKVHSTPVILSHGKQCSSELNTTKLLVESGTRSVPQDIVGTWIHSSQSLALHRNAGEVMHYQIVTQ